MERTACLGALLGLSLIACTASMPSAESEFTSAPNSPAEVAADPVAQTDKQHGIAARAPEFAGSTPLSAATPVPCIPTEAPFAGCVMTHDIDTNTLAHDVSMTCGAQKQASNGCGSKPLSFEFVDEWANTPAKLTIAFDTGYFCATEGAGLMQVVELNGHPVGAFMGNTSDCTCDAAAKQRAIEVPAESLSMLKPCLMNRVSIVGPNHCLALRPKAEWQGAYARVTATY
jgi:hypothetical protein